MPFLILGLREIKKYLSLSKRDNEDISLIKRDRKNISLRKREREDIYLNRDSEEISPWKNERADIERIYLY